MRSSFTIAFSIKLFLHFKSFPLYHLTWNIPAVFLHNGSFLLVGNYCYNFYQARLNPLEFLRNFNVFFLLQSQLYSFNSFSAYALNKTSTSRSASSTSRCPLLFDQLQTELLRPFFALSPLFARLLSDSFQLLFLLVLPILKLFG